MKLIALIVFLMQPLLSFGLDACKPMRYELALTTESDTIYGYVYDCFTDPQYEFTGKEDFIEYFLHSEDTTLNLFVSVKQIIRLKGIDIALDSKIIEISVSSFSKLEVIGVKQMRYATSTMIVNESQFHTLTDSSAIKYFTNPTITGGFCDSVLLTLYGTKSSEKLDSIAKGIQTELSATQKDEMGGYSELIEEIRRDLSSQHILYFDICGP